MKKLVLLLLPLFILACSVAEAIADLDNFDITITETTTIQGGGVVTDLLGQIDFAGFNDFDIEDNQEFQNKDIPKSNIEWTKVRKLHLQLLTPQGNTFDFVDSIRFYIESPQHDKVQLGRSGAVDASADEILFLLDNVDIAPYLKDESMNISTEFHGRQPSKDTEVQVTMDFEIEAKL